MSDTELHRIERDPTNEEILTALKTIGISGGTLEVHPRGTGGGETFKWCFWVKNKTVYRDDSPSPVAPPTAG